MRVVWLPLLLIAASFFGVQWLLPSVPARQGSRVREALEQPPLAERLNQSQSVTISVSRSFEAVQRDLNFFNVTNSTADLTEQAHSNAFPSGVEDGQCVGAPQDTAGVVAAVVSVTFNRKAYLQQHMDSVLAVHGLHPSNKQRFPLFVSQDGTPPNQDVAALAHSLAAQGVHYLHHMELVPPTPKSRKESLAYYRIANHYKFIMQTFFDCFHFPRLIILEDDMKLSPDFFSYFNATAPLLDRDPSLFCVSSWNDHGQAQFVQDPLRLLRSDFFPGLGWMLTRTVWEDIRPTWPGGYWDDWMRLGAVRKGRQCIRPEICRTYNFGAVGSSKGQYFRAYLQHTALNEERIDWSAQDLGYLEPARYEREFNATLAKAHTVSDALTAKAASGPVKLIYDTRRHYELLAKQLGILPEWKDGVPRGAYHHVVQIRFKEAHIFLAPAPGFRVGIDDQPLQVPLRKGLRTVPAQRTTMADAA